MTIQQLIALTANTIDNICKQICEKNSIFDQIIDTMISPNYHQKPELISELAISFVMNKEKIERVANEGWFKYFFIRAVKNQVHSKTSPFHKNVRQTISSSLTDNQDYELESLQEDNYDSDEKELKEFQFETIELAMSQINVTYFESELFKQYYYNNLTYRQIEKETGVDHSLVWITVRKVFDKLKKQIDKNNIY